MENSNVKCTAVMLAAGMGLRMGGDIRKQYLMLDGMPMFLHSIRTMQESEHITDIIVMAHKDDVEIVRDLLEEYGFTKKLRRIEVGGKERVHSVAIGLEAIDWPCDYVFIHDCARPFLDMETIERLYQTVKNTGACVAGVPAKDTVKIVDEAGNPVVGAMVQICQGETCMPGPMTGSDGTVTFNVEEADYKVSFLGGVPAGYEYTTEETEFYFEDGSYEMTIVLKAVA